VRRLRIGEENKRKKEEERRNHRKKYNSLPYWAAIITFNLD